ncbi:hypothetical protein EJB05_12037, partial [Eragrostis curvula]
MVPLLPLLAVLLLARPPDAAAAAYAEYSCNGTAAGNFTAGSAFASNLDLLLAALPGNASSSPSLFATASIGTGDNNNDTAYGLALCRGDMTDAAACFSCLADAFARLRRLCPSDRDATFYHDLCTARYSGEDFLSRPDDNNPVINGMDATNATTYPGWDASNATTRSFFLSLVGTLFGEMSMYAAYNASATRRFASAVMFINPTLPTVYGLAQCTPDLAPAQCWRCLNGVGELNKQWYDGREGGRIMGVRCSFRYEGYQFYAGAPDVRIGLPAEPSSSSPANGSNGSNHKKVLIIVLTVSITVLCCLLLCGLLLIRRQRKGAAAAGALPEQLQDRGGAEAVADRGEQLRAWQVWKDGRAFELIDPTLGECGDVAGIMRCVRVALLCVQDNATDRPTMADVTAMLASAAGDLPDPRRPPHFRLRVSSSDDDGGWSEARTRSTQGTTSCSTNDLTITTIQEGR